MAPFTTTSAFFFFFLTTIILSTQIHARESFFFGKFHRENGAQGKNPNVFHAETSQKTSVEILPKKEQEQQQNQDPSFVPESENGYGLYGHETTYNNNNEEPNKQYEENVNYEPYSTPSLSQTEEFNNNNNKNFNNNEKYNKQYEETTNYEPYSTPVLSQTEESFDSNNNNNGKDKNYYYNSNAYGGERSEYKGYSNNMGRLGMSDTRYVESGKYFYDVNDERNHGDMYKKHYRHSPSSSSSEFYNDNEQRGHFYDNNNEMNSFQDPYNSKWEKNMMNGQEEEFGDEQQDQFKP